MCYLIKSSSFAFPLHFAEVPRNDIAYIENIDSIINQMSCHTMPDWIDFVDEYHKCLVLSN